MIYAAVELPNRGDLDTILNSEKSPIGSQNAGAFYVKHAYHDAHTPNMVTVTLADYRGYDTMGETTVIFTAALICFLLLRRERNQNDKKE
jgi:multicomponent Na+:H+ antiporter subunit B